MLYQKIFTDEKPYSINFGRLFGFPVHRHADFEINYAFEDFDISVDNRTYRVEKGYLIFIPSMCSHEIPKNEKGYNVLTVIGGISLLKNCFNLFSAVAKEPAMYDLNLAENRKIKELICECKELISSSKSEDGLLIMGNAYAIFAHLFKKLSQNKSASAENNDYRKIQNVEKALELIKTGYNKSLTVKDAARITGYSQSNFCKIFKEVVGESFHHMLNRRRIECAKNLLLATNMSVAEISAEVGFYEPKAFCRVFKSFLNITPGQYRNRINV
jgi:AraC-like DNA-binding protein